MPGSAPVMLALLLNAPCAATPVDHLLRGVIDTATGADPVWMADGSAGHVFDIEIERSTRTIVIEIK